jgi:hypothetical protein
LFVQVFGDLFIVSYWIDTLVLKLREILTLLCCITLSSSREEPAQAQELAGTHMNVDSGERPHTPGLGTPRSSLKRNSIISQRDKIRIPKKRG